MNRNDLDSRTRVLALLRRYGWNATAFQVLEPDFSSYWFDGHDACVAYVETGRAWVVAGAPIAPEERMGEVAARFVAHARSRRRRVAFFAVEGRFLRAIDVDAIRIGEQPWWEPGGWEGRVRGHRSLREQVRRARAKGVAIERVGGVEGMRAEIERLIARWLASKPMPAMAFLVELDPFVFAEERRYYVARRNGELRGLLVAVPVYLREGWFFEDILRDPAAPNGTAEALIDFAMRDVAADGAQFVTLGLAPLAGEGPWLALARRSFKSLYNFEGLRAFKAKLRPDGWDPIYLAWPHGRTAIGALRDALAAFARGKLLAFGAAALLRVPSIVLTGLGALLVPWTLLLAVADARWFPSKRVRVAWVVFDTAMAASLFTLSRKWRPRLARATAIAAAADAMLTAAQAVTWNVPRAKRRWDYAIIGASIAAPLVCAALLFTRSRSNTTR